jgi:Leucine-rich repeat (LRR) protein
MTLSACASYWFAIELANFHLEKKSVMAIEDSLQGILIGDNEDANGPILEPQFDLSQIWHGRLYSPVTTAFIAERPVSENDWHNLQSLRYLKSLKFQKCQLESQKIEFSQFSRLVELHILDTSLSQRQIHSLKGLSHLEELYLDNSGSHDGWMDIISSLEKLRCLAVDGDVTDAGVAQLSRMHRLRGLSLAGSRVTSRSGAVIGELQEIEWLNLDNTSIDDTFLESLGTLASLDTLRLGNTQITDVGIRHLGSLKKLRVLNLSNTRITDGSALYLAGLPKLEILDLSGTDITNQTLSILDNAPSLRELEIARTRIDKSRAEEWRENHARIVAVKCHK